VKRSIGIAGRVLEDIIKKGVEKTWCQVYYWIRLVKMETTGKLLSVGQ
jgi:hypothetical protein